MMIESVSPDAAQRFRGHEGIVHQICSLVQEEAQARGLALLQIDVRPAWSHEYDERTGIVIDMEIRASSDERFSYWDAVCNRISDLEDLLPLKEKRFLQDQVSCVVNRVDKSLIVCYRDNDATFLLASFIFSFLAPNSRWIHHPAAVASNMGFWKARDCCEKLA